MDKYYHVEADSISMPTWHLSRWWRTENQMANINAVINSMPAQAKSILDIGCGAGELYRQLKEHKIDVEYKGIDIVPTVINAAKYHNPDADISVDDGLSHEGK